MQLRIENKLHPILKNKLLDLTHLPAQPYLRQYNENDLLTEIERPNPDWHEGDPEDERYIIEYIDEGYTGFLPVNLQIENPNFVQLWGKEDENNEITTESLPINENGKYKFLFNDQTAFANGYIPVKRYDNETNDYDYNINVTGNLYDPYPYESPLQITSNDPGIQSITFDSSNYDGLKTIYYTVNVPQSITTAYTLNYVKYQTYDRVWNDRATINVSDFQTNVTLTLTPNYRVSGAIFYYNLNTNQMIVEIHSSSVTKTFNNGLYYICYYNNKRANQDARIIGYGSNQTNPTNNTQLFLLTSDQNRTLNVPSNVIINL